MILKMVLFHLILFSCKISNQIIANSNNTQILIFPEVNLQPYSNNSSVYYPNDTIISTAVTPTHLYTLSTDNVLQVYDKNNSSILEANITQHFLKINQSTAFQFMAMAFDEDFSTLALSAFSNSTLKYILYNIANDSLPKNSQTLSSLTPFSYSPLSTFIANSIVYSFFSAAATNDTLFGLRLNDNSTFTITLPTINSSIAISPNHKYGLVWTENSQVYIFNVTNNFSLLYIYNNSMSNQAATTQSIKFSEDSAYALLQTDNHNPIDVIRLIDFSSLFSITIHKKMISVDFLDKTNRFILINCASLTYAYDTVSSALLTFNASLSAASVLVDQNSSQLIAEVNGLYSVWGINITINGSIAFWHTLTTTTTVTANSTTNNSATNTSSNNSQPSITTSKNASVPFSYPLNLTTWQNQTFSSIQSISHVIENIMNKFNSIVFSSPLMCFFLGFFNYFVLNSIYVLLNLPLPDIVFNQISSIFNSTNTNLLASIGIKFTVSPFTDELVNQDKPLYFGISSDLLSTDYYPFIIIALNIVLVEVILIIRHSIPKRFILYHFLDFKRERIYFGFVVSVIVGNVLPWKYILLGQQMNGKTKLNTGFYHMVFVLIIYFLCIGFIQSFDQFHQRNAINRAVIGRAIIQFQSKDKLKKCKKLSRLPEWIIGFQNFLYPLLVLLQSPMYFLVIVLLSKTVQVVIFVKHSKRNIVSKFFQMFSFVCELIYHSTFFVFAFCTDESVISYNSIICLGFFFLGAVLNFVLVLVFLVSVAIKICKASKRSNQIAQMDPFRQNQAIERSNFPKFTIKIVREQGSVNLNQQINEKNTVENQFSNAKRATVLNRIGTRKNKNVRFEMKMETQIKYNYFDL